jgi:RND superfamily putative drug exporter
VTAFLYRLGRRCAENGWRVVAIWFVVAVVVMGANRLFGGEAKDSFILRGTDSSSAQDLLNRAFPGTSAEAVPVVLHSESVDFARGKGASTASDVADGIAAIPHWSVTTGARRCCGSL